jgi:hypothetical protein
VADEVLGPPSGIRAGLFDLDGVLTPTATAHAAAWKELFDELVRHRGRVVEHPHRRGPAGGDGLHIASLAGAWIALVGGFGGMRDSGGSPTFTPPTQDRIATNKIMIGSIPEAPWTAPHKPYI